jgi:hypothetical protein
VQLFRKLRRTAFAQAICTIPHRSTFQSPMCFTEYLLKLRKYSCAFKRDGDDVFACAHRRAATLLAYKKFISKDQKGVASHKKVC